MFSCSADVICINLILLKQRKNPFNTEITASHSIEGQDNQLLDRPAAQTQTPYEGESSDIACANLKMYCMCMFITLSVI